MSSAARDGVHSGDAQYGRLEHDALAGEPVEVRRLHDVVAVRGQPLRGELVRHQQEDVAGGGTAGR